MGRDVNQQILFHMVTKTTLELFSVVNKGVLGEVTFSSERFSTVWTTE